MLRRNGRLPVCLQAYQATIMKAQAHAEIEEKLNKEELPGLLEK